MKKNGQKSMAKVEPKRTVNSGNSMLKPSKAEENVHKMPSDDLKPTESRVEVILNSEISRCSGRKRKFTEKIKEANLLHNFKQQKTKESISTVVVRCSIKSCRKPKSDGYSLHTFPKDKSILDKWIKNCHNHIDNMAGSKCYLLKVCGRHFEDRSFLNPNNKFRLSPSAVPTLFHNSDKSKTTKPSTVTEGTATDLPTECTSPNKKIIDVTVPLTSSSTDNFENDSVSPTDKMNNHNQDTNTKSLIEIVPPVSTPEISQNDDLLLENVDKTSPAEVLIKSPSVARHRSSDVTDLDLRTPVSQVLEPINSEPNGDSLLENIDKISPPAEILIEPPSVVKHHSSNTTNLEIPHTPDSQTLESIDSGPTGCQFHGIRKSLLKIAPPISTPEISQNDDSLLENVAKTIPPAEVLIELPSVSRGHSSSTTDLDPHTLDLRTLESIDGGPTGRQLDNPIGQRNTKLIKTKNEITIVGISTGVYKQFADLCNNYLAVLLPKNWKVMWYGSLQTVIYHHTRKEVTLYCLTPSISVFENNYEYGQEIKSRLELETLLKQVDTLDECFGNDKGFNPHCVGYYDGVFEVMCCKCLEWIEARDLFKDRTATCHKNLDVPVDTQRVVINFEDPSYDDIKLKQMMRLFSMDEVRGIFNSMFGKDKKAKETEKE